jgi:hypothetical protein
MRRAASSRWLTLLATLPLLLLGGCLDYSEVLTLTPDGGGRLEAEVTIDLGLMRRLSLALGEELEDEGLASPSHDEVLAALSVEGVTVRELRVEDQAGQTRIHLAVDFADLAALHRIDGFGARRRLELYDHGDGQVLLVSSFDPREVIPLPEEAERWAQRGGLAPHAARALEEVLLELRRSVRLRSELRLPGPILASNGHLDAAGPAVDAAAWAVDERRDPERHVDLGRREVLMKVLCERRTVPWVQALAPVPPEVGSVADDALGPVTGAVAVAAISSEAPAGARRRGAAGCSVSADPGPASPFSFGWLLVGCGLLLLRRSASRRGRISLCAARTGA